MGGFISLYQKMCIMKSFFAVMITSLSVACSISKNEISDHHHLPELSYQQMLEDHDTLVSYIKQTSPIIYFNKEVRAIDFEEHAKNLRRQINKKTTTEVFLQIVEKTLNAAQDGHTNRLGKSSLDNMIKYWIPSGFVENIDSASAENSYKYIDYFKEEVYTKLDLNLVYTDGEYYNLLPFEYKGKNYPASMKLITCNGKEIHTYVNNLIELVSPLRWDRMHNRVYHENFYTHTENYKKGKLHLIFTDKKSKKHTLTISKNDTVSFLLKANWKYGYNKATDSLITHYFEKEKIFYAKIPQMKEELGDSVSRRLEKIISKNQINAVVIDIRGNGGGSDNTYAKFLKKIVQDTLKSDIIIGRNFSAFNQEYFKINRDSINKRTSHTFKVDVPTLKEPELYYIKQSYNFVIPDSARFSFKGKIYVLQDRYIYSSASNLSSLAKNSEQLISIGQTPDLFGGLQTNPAVIMLPNSKVIFRVEPQIDLTNIKSVSDIFQNHVEVPVHYSIEELYLRSTMKGNIFEKNILINHDPVFKKVLAMEMMEAGRKAQ
jgi:hypothetical protein